MRILLVLALLLLASAPRAGTPGATITGKVQPQDGVKIKPKQAYVYLEQVGYRKRSKTPPGEGMTAVIKQQGHEFVPHVVIVPVGASVRFPNFANEEHNVFTPTAPGFDLGRYNHDEKGKSWKFQVDGAYRIYCDIHQEMSAFVKVVDTTYIAEVNVDGTFTLTGVPPGRYKVVAWMPNAKEDVKSEAIEVSDGGTFKVDRILSPNVLPEPPHLRKDGTAYKIDYQK